MYSTAFIYITIHIFRGNWNCHTGGTVLEYFLAVLVVPLGGAQSTLLLTVVARHGDAGNAAADPEPGW
eukprot:COSAG02_NODE_8731_length_2460_cov_4.432591_2_plen_68_part_00